MYLSDLSCGCAVYGSAFGYFTLPRPDNKRECCLAQSGTEHMTQTMPTTHEPQQAQA